MWRRFLAYGLGGWALEAGVSGVVALRGRATRPQGWAELARLPLYGAGGLALERAHARLGALRVRRYSRAAAYAVLMAAAAEASGALGGRARPGPWARLASAPLWYALALAFEPFEREVAKLQRRPRTRRPLTARTAALAGMAMVGADAREEDLPEPTAASV